MRWRRGRFGGAPTFPEQGRGPGGLPGRGAFRTWRPEQLADYVEAGFHETADGAVTLACTPAWEASNFRTHNYNPWAALRATRCPIRMLRAEEGSTARIDDHEAELTASGRIRVETIPGTSHFLPMERPELAREVLAEAARA